MECPNCHQNTYIYKSDFKQCLNCNYSKNSTPLDKFKAWSYGRVWWLRLPLLAYFAYLLHRNLQSYTYSAYRAFSNPFALIDFVIHELGHVVFIPLGEFMMIAGGSILQCLVPIFAIAGFYRHKYFFAMAMSFSWLSLNLFDVATYAADASSRALPLFSPFDPLGAEGKTGHDWYQLLSRLNILEYDYLVTDLIRTAAVFVMFSSFLIALYLMFLMMKNRHKI